MPATKPQPGKHMPFAIRIHQPGGPEVLVWEATDLAEPGPGEVRLRHTAVGLNYIDVYHRSGYYPQPSYPFTPGLEGAGVVESVGAGVDLLSPGDRVAYCKGPLGAYGTHRILAQEHLVKIPDAVSDAQAAAILLKGQTAHMLLKRTYPVGPGQTILVHAAAGGVGLVLCQWASLLGATVIGTVGSEEKAAFARENGCAHTILYAQEDVKARVRDITGGTGCNVVYDSVGKATFEASLDSLVPFGLLVSFGQSSGPPPPLELKTLMEKGSLFVTRPTLMHYKRDYQEYLTGASELFSLVQAGKIKVHVGQSYYLHDAAAAHRDLEARATRGSTVLFPDGV